MRAPLRKTSLKDSVVVHLAERSDLDAGLVHRQREVGEASVLGDVPVGTGQQQPVVGVVRARRPDLLPGDDPLVAVALGAGREPGQVRAGAGLAEQLAPRRLAGEDRLPAAVAAAVGAVGEDGRRGERHPPAERRTDRADGTALLGHDPLGPRRQIPPEPRRRPRRHHPAAGHERPAPLDQRQVGIPVRLQPLPDRSPRQLVLGARRTGGPTSPIHISLGARRTRGPTSPIQRVRVHPAAAPRVKESIDSEP